MLKAERHERPPCLPKLVLMQDETRRDWSKLNSYELFFFHPYTQLFMKEMCQWGHHPETCQRHSPAPQGAWTLHLAPMCAYFTVCILDHPEEESASSQCLSMAGSQASLGHSSRQLSGTKIFFFFFFGLAANTLYSKWLSAFLHKGCFWKQIPQTCLFWAPPLQLWSTHSVAKTQRAVVFSVPFLSGSMLGICGYNWSQLESFHPCHTLAEHQEGTRYSRLLCYPTGEQGESSSECLVYGGDT